MRAVFMGTPEFAVPSLDALVEVCRARGGDVVGVVCQPDRPSGRGLVLTPPPVKVRALEHGLDVFQPRKVRDGTLAQWVHARDADVALVVAYGRILPREVLEAPRVGCVNAHASLLPRYRGAAPITWAIVRGERETGVGLMHMDEGLDTGAVYAERRLAIDPDETAGELSKRLAALAALLVREELAEVVLGRRAPTPQDHARATLAPLLKKEDGAIDWAQPASVLHDHVRGMSPWPGAYTRIDGARVLKVHRTRLFDGVVSSGAARAPGIVLVADKHHVLVACGPSGAQTLELLEAQPEGKKILAARELAAGRVLAVSQRLGA